MAGLTFRVGGNGHEDADASHPLALLRLRCERPRAAEKGDERAPSHRGYFFIVSRSFIQAAIPARADFSSTPSGNPATPTPPTSWPSTASGTPPPTR